MTAFFLLALLFLLLWPVIKIGYKIYRAQRQMRKAFEQASQQQQQQQKQEADREKIFDRNVGEYVDFEEIENTDGNSEPHYNPTVKIEPQIEDAEWEDIK